MIILVSSKRVSVHNNLLHSVSQELLTVYSFMLYVLASLACCFQAKNLNVQILWPVGFIIHGKSECFGVLSCGIQKLDILVYIFKKRNGPNHVDPFFECNEIWHQS